MSLNGPRSPRQLAIVVDDVPLVGATPNRYALQAALAALDEQERETINRLRDHLGPDVGILDSFFDDIPQLLEVLGLRPRLMAGEDLGDASVLLAAIGCSHRRTRLDAVDTERFFERGGILISSDHAIRLPGVATHLHSLRGRPPARARLQMEIAGEDESLPQAAVWLHPGNAPLDDAGLRERGARVLAVDSMLGDPMVVVQPVGGGAIIHGVPHWVQAPAEGMLTAVEALPLRSVPAFSAIGNSYPSVTLGAFRAQHAMLRLLLHGLKLAIEGMHAETRGNAQNEG